VWFLRVGGDFGSAGGWGGAQIYRPKDLLKIVVMLFNADLGTVDNRKRSVNLCWRILLRIVR